VRLASPVQAIHDPDEVGDVLGDHGASLVSGSDEQVDVRE